MLATILQSLKGELARLEALDAEIDADAAAAERDYSARMKPYFDHYTEIRRLKQAIAALES